MAPDLTGADGATGVVAPSREDPFVRASSAVVGGPSGERVRPGRHGWWTAVRVLVVLSMVVLALGVVGKQHCRAQGWSTPDQFFHACYSDLPLLYEQSGLSQGVVPYVDSAGGSYLAQPVLTGLAMWAVAQVTPSGDLVPRDRAYFDVSTVLVAVLLVGLVWLTASAAGRRRPWDAAVVALSPLVALSALVSLDLLGVTLAAGGLLAWGRRRPLLAGVLLGLAVTARSYPVVLLLVLALLAARTGRWREWAVTAAAAVGTTVAVLAPWWVLNADGVKAAYQSWQRSSAGYGSLWVLPQTVASDPRPRWVTKLGLEPHTLSAGAVTTLSVLGVVLALVVGLLLVLATDRRPRVAQVAFVVLAVVVLTGKSWPVQASLWLLPLAALARPRWRDQLVWVGAEATYFFGVWLYVGAQSNPDRGLPGSWYSLLLLVRAAGLLWLVWCVVRDARRPEHDVVRASGEDDPLGGPFEGADDALVVRFG
ncbi:glycosyltransferase 87 family protein [Angustibacter peucedani]